MPTLEGLATGLDSTRFETISNKLMLSEVYIIISHQSLFKHDIFSYKRSS